MRTSSLWEHTLSFFPQFMASLQEHASPGASVAVVGTSDGKFVLPVAAAGYRVIAIERDLSPCTAAGFAFPVTSPPRRQD
jgi:hypothetical protein